MEEEVTFWDKLKSKWTAFTSRKLLAGGSLVVMMLVLLIIPVIIAHPTNLFSNASSYLFGSCTPIPRGLTQQQIQQLSQSGKVRWCSNPAHLPITISLNPSTTSFPIQSPLSGTNTFSCTNNTSDKSWFFSQWNNEQNLCGGSTKPDQNCNGADFFRATLTGRVCWWKTNRQVQLALNTQSMKNNGCNITAEPNWSTAPGGYSIFLSYDPSKRPDFYSTFPNLRQLNSLTLQTGFTNNYFQGGKCPVNTNISVFPNTTSPVTQSYINVIATDMVNPSHDVLFLQTILYDNRYSSNTASGPIYTSCKGSEGIYDDLVSTAYGAPLALPGGTNMQYSLNILPHLKKYITQCFGNTQNFSLANYKFTGMFMGSENVNSTITTVTATNPQILLK